MEYGALAAVLALCLAPVVYAFFWWLRKNDDYWAKRGVPHSPRESFYTAIKTFLEKPFHVLLFDLQKKHGRIFGSFEFRQPNLSVSDPELLRDILVKDFHVFHCRRDMVTGDRIFNKFLVVMKGEDWKRVRTVITPAFTSKRMRQVSQVMNDCAESMLRTIGKSCGRRESVDVRGMFGAFAMDVIASAAFATKINSHDDPENIFIKQAQRNFLQSSVKQMIGVMMLPRWLAAKMEFVNQDSMNFFKNVILRVVKERRETGKRYSDFLQLLMDAQDEAEKEKRDKTDSQEDEADQFGSILSEEVQQKLKYKKLSEDELIAQCVLFFVAGFETTAATLTFIAYELALNPQVQDKLIQEVDDAYEKQKTFDHDTIRDMKYLDCVVSETLRKYPVAARAERTASEDYQLGNTGIVIEKGMVVGFNIYCMHHDPEFFPNPEKFLPERFLPENVTHPQYAYLPFGAGPRNCLGMRFALMEMKICICNILRRFRFKQTTAEETPLDFKKGFGLMSVDKLPLLMEERDDAVTAS